MIVAVRLMATASSSSARRSRPRIRPLSAADRARRPLRSTRGGLGRRHLRQVCQLTGHLGDRPGAFFPAQPCPGPQLARDLPSGWPPERVR